MIKLEYNATKDRYLLRFKFNHNYIGLARQISGGFFDRDLEAWSFPSDVQSVKLILSVFYQLEIQVNLREIPKRVGIFDDLFDAIRIRNYSLQTAKTYYSNIFCLCSYYQKLPNRITFKDIVNYIKIQQIEYNKSVTTIRSMQQSFLFYFKKSIYLPEVLSESEVLSLCHSLTNFKHKLLLKLAYSSGLRVSEVVKLKYSHIDFDRKMIKIQQGKGKKDRYSLLAESLLSELQFHKEEQRKNYKYKQNPSLPHSKISNDWIFPGSSNSHLSIRTAEKIFENARDKAQIQKKVSFHSLRHAFATHLLEHGTDIRLIQTLLGHASLRTTQIYTKVSSSRIEKIRSPLDHIIFKE